MKIHSAKLSLEYLDQMKFDSQNRGVQIGQQLAFQYSKKKKEPENFKREFILEKERNKKIRIVCFQDGALYIGRLYSVSDDCCLTKGFYIKKVNELGRVAQLKSGPSPYFNLIELSKPLHFSRRVVSFVWKCEENVWNDWFSIFSKREETV